MGLHALCERWLAMIQREVSCLAMYVFAPPACVFVLVQSSVHFPSKHMFSEVPRL